MNKDEWLAKAMGDDSVNEMATKAGISSATAWRQYNNALGFSAENVILIARAYHKNPISALVAFGYLRPDEPASAGTEQALRDASDDELMDEMARRLANGAAARNQRWGSPITFSPEDLGIAANMNPDKDSEANTPDD
ncbi:hypothetical protein [Bifidobacterium actinocoloniiforme]|nr:hypothetical protein [Bifidobacterium actinocoloniiforme]